MSRISAIAGRALLSLFLMPVTATALLAQSDRVGDLTVLERDVPKRLVGYGLVVGLEGTGDESFGNITGATHTVKSVANLLKRFGIFVPETRMRLRNVAAVLVTAEISPYLRAGGRFDATVASIGDATSLRGGQLWMTPLMEDVGRPVVATVQGPLLISEDGNNRLLRRRGTSGRIPDGGVLEVDPTIPATAASPLLILRQPDKLTALRIANAINGAFGDGTAAVSDPGAVQLNFGAQGADTVFAFLAAVDTVSVVTESRARLVVDAHTGAVVAGGNQLVGPAVVSQGGIMLTISGTNAAQNTTLAPGVVAADEGASVQEIAAGLHAAGATPREIAAIFEALRDVGAIRMQVIIR